MPKLVAKRMLEFKVLEIKGLGIRENSHSKT